MMKQHNQTILNTVEHGESKLIKSGIDQQEAKLEATVLLSYILSKPKSYILTWPDQILSIGQKAMYNTLIQRRANREPLAYILGYKEFYSLLFKVTPDTLIPRPETELLVDTVLENFKDQQNNKLNILDLGTGSGIIAITIAKSRPDWQMQASDISNKALTIAKENANTLYANHINFMQSSWFENIDNNQKFDCIVSNPPYIQNDYLDSETNLNLNKELTFEPKQALFSDNNGLQDIEHLINKAYLYLKPNGVLIIEHGYQQLDNIKDIIKNTNNWAAAISIKDHSNLPRILILKL